MIDPHGGKLVHRIPGENETVYWHEYSLFQRKIIVDPYTEMDLELLAIGAYSPLNGFMSHKEYQHVLIEQRLPSGIAWALPVILPISREELNGLREGQDITLRNQSGKNVAIMRIQEIYEADKTLEIESLYGSADLSHSGVVRIRQQGEVLLAGPIIYLDARKPDDCYSDYYLTPFETRAHFQELGWNKIIAFEPRNPSLIGSRIQSLGEYDGIFLHPLVGDVTGEDLPAAVKIRCSEILLQEYYPPDRTLLAVSPVFTRGAGWRDVLHQAIVRKNFGVTHMIVNDQSIDLLSVSAV